MQNCYQENIKKILQHPDFQVLNSSYVLCHPRYFNIEVHSLSLGSTLPQFVLKAPFFWHKLNWQLHSHPNISQALPAVRALLSPVLLPREGFSTHTPKPYTFFKDQSVKRSCEKATFNRWNQPVFSLTEGINQQKNSHDTYWTMDPCTMCLLCKCMPHLLK